MSVDLDEGVVNFVNVPEKLVEKITEDSAEAEQEEWADEKDYEWTS